MGRALFAIALGSVVLVGCPQSGERGGGGDIPIDALATELARGYCDLVFRCDIADDEAIMLELLFEDREACAAHLERTVFGSGELGPLMRAVAEGTVTYDPAAARACISSSGPGCSATVGADFGDGSSCDTVFTGTVTEGGACWIDEECAGDLGCDTGAGMCPGSCQPRTTTAPSCGDGPACPAGQDCFYPETGTARCVVEVFEPDAAAGQSCGLISETDTEVRRRACAPGSWCTGSSSSPGTCRAPIAAGEPCTTSDDEVCVDGHLCIGGSCTALTIVRTAGGSCDMAGEVCDPFARLDCIDGACVSYTDGREGSPCLTGDFGLVSCNEGLVCRSTETCGPTLPAGSLCESAHECASGDCDSTTGTCRERYCG